MRKRNNIYKWGSILSSLLVIVSLIAFNVSGEEKVTFTHIHGLGYTNDGEEIYVPAHDGLRVYKDGTWTIPTEGSKHDYMGFNMFKDGFYSSGHPAPNSDLANPLGIVKSTNKGKTIEKLALYKEIDFHGMAVGYKTEEIYVFNPTKNSQMDQPGFYYSTDEAKTWEQSKLAGIEGQAIALAAHPTKKGVVTVGTNQGIFLSEDHGNNFEKLSITGSVSAVSFGHQNNLLVATKTDEVSLFQIDLSTQESVELNVPDPGEDAISYIKQNPANKDEFIFATHKKDIYISNDAGNTWNQNVDEGVAIPH
ncbi:F510_1955 family glycosylhydrolase [Virgibacillus sp. DJP39]|uniref:F510_1955 family glycosylhydrolase n=1 Tax=Virgibacillus sp. DJP39 TaxID=3409790 RepID=UPI003BB7F4E8